MEVGSPGIKMLQEAAKTVQKRGEVYGEAKQDMARIAKMWSGILGVDITAAQIPMCMIAVKLSRLSETTGHLDSTVDIAGYAAVLRECQEK